QQFLMQAIRTRQQCKVDLLFAWVNLEVSQTRKALADFLRREAVVIALQYQSPDFIGGRYLGFALKNPADIVGKTQNQLYLACRPWRYLDLQTPQLDVVLHQP